MFHVPNVVFEYLKASPVSDLIDRLNHAFVPTVLFCFTLMISTKQWIGSPIQCWLPKEFSGQWNQYAEDYCFIHETYYSEIDNVGKITAAQKKENSAGYYQWVPVFLALSAIFFYLPMFIYQNIIRKKAGLDVQKWVEGAIKIKNADLADQDKQLKPYTDDLARQLLARSRRKNHLDAVFLYILMKVVYCMNLIGQIYHMNLFLGHESLWAFWSLFEMANGNDWTNRGYFPRVTFCDFRVRDLGNTRPYSVQCVLMINMFNEKVYIFLWSLYVILFVCTVSNLFFTVYNFYCRSRLSDYVYSMLVDSDPTGSRKDEWNTKGLVEAYTNETLGKEALLALRLIETHTDRRLCTRINRRLYDETKRLDAEIKEQIAEEEKKKSNLPGTIGPNDLKSNNDQKKPLDSVA